MAFLKNIYLSTKNISAKGRNGYFTAVRVDIWQTPIASNRGIEPDIHVDVYSKRTGDAPPLSIIGPKDQIEQLFQKIHEVLNSAI